MGTQLEVNTEDTREVELNAIRERRESIKIRQEVSHTEIRTKTYRVYTETEDKYGERFNTEIITERKGKMNLTQLNDESRPGTTRRPFILNVITCQKNLTKRAYI